VGWVVSRERTPSLIQDLVDSSLSARFYYSDLFAVYRMLVYAPAVHTPMPDKSETFRVEGTNAELRHYLARLARASRCFSRSLSALTAAVKLFVFLWNSRQLAHHRFPRYHRHLIDFLPALP
jgi:IS1 family transposase